MNYSALICGSLLACCFIPVSGITLAAEMPDNSPKSKFVRYAVGERNVKDIFADGDIVWVGTSGGLVRYDTKNDEYRHFDVRNGLLANGVFHVSRLDKNNMVIGTYGGGLTVLNEATGHWKRYNIPQGLGDAFVYDFIKLSNGDYWIATWTGANRIKNGELDNPDAWEVFTVKNTQGGLPNDWVYGLAEGKNGEVWFATEGGLARFKEKQWAHWTHAEGLGANYELVKEDSAFGTDPADYSRHHAQQKIEQGLQGVNTAYNPNYIVSMTVADNGDVWVGTWGAGLSHFNGKQFEVFTQKDGLPSNHVFMLKKDTASGGLWIGTNKGLSLFKGGKILNTIDREDGLISETVFSMDIDQHGEYWVGSYGGVTRIKSAQ
jgi:ligand-binding sensor domain-containing protein